MLLAAAADTSNFLTALVVIISVIGLIGGGGVVAIVRYTKQQGIRDARLDAAADKILGNPEKNIISIEDEMGRRLDAIEHSIVPNGGTTQLVGDKAARAEKKADDNASVLATHMGASSEVHDDLRRRVSRLERAQSGGS